MSQRIWIALGAISAAVSVGLGAYHAHSLESSLQQRGVAADDLTKQMHSFDVGVRYQTIHAIALVIIGILLVRGHSRWMQAAGWLFIAGTLLFSGCLYIPILAAVKLPWYLVPSGGLAFILGWIVLAIGALFQHSPEK